MKKRLLLMLVMMFCLLALGIRIAPAEEITVSAPAPEFETVDGGMSSEEAFEGYILQAFGQPPARRVLLKATRPLTGSNKLLYDHLVEIIKNVAAGKQSSTLCQIPMSEFGIKTSYTLEELGFTEVVDEAWDAFYARVETEMALDLPLIGNKLRADFPYEMYWASSYRRTSGGLPGVSSDGQSIFFRDGAVFEYPIYVSAAYSVSGADQTTDFDTSRAEAVQQAAANAKAIVARYANASSDYGKLRGFKNAICDLVDYNHEAVKNKSTPYGDPWQLVWVFDGNPSTKVVCEGYSKAFKYLCDMSSFADGTSASIVTGWMSGGTGAGAHMWNIVTMNGVNYLVDVTNCDGEPNADKVSVGYPDYLFMVGYSDTSDTADGTWYIYRAGQNSISYLYDADILNLYAAEDIEVTTAGYEARPYILASAETIELGESVTLTMSVPGLDELTFKISYTQDGISHGEIKGVTPSYQQNEMSLEFTPDSAGEYVFYAEYYDDTEDRQITDASVRVTVTAPVPDPLTVTGEMIIGTDVEIQIAKQDGWNNLRLEIEYLPGGGTAEIVNGINLVSDSVSFIGTNFQKAGAYRAVLYRAGETPELASVDFRMAPQDPPLPPTQGTLSAEEITVGDELTFSCSGAEALACQLRITNPVTGAKLREDNPPLSPSVNGDTLAIDYQNTAGILEGYIWAKLAGLWRQPQAIRVVISQPPTPLTDENVNVYFGAESAEIEKDIGSIVLAGTEGLSGEPEWSVTRTAGTAPVTVTGNGKTALLSVVSFPSTEEEAVYTVTCVWDSQKWEKKYTVHFLDLSGKQTPRTRLAADGLFWVAKTGDPLDLQNCFTVVSDWTPAEGDSVRVEAELSADNEAFFTLNSNTRALTPNTPGRYELDLKLALNNVSWIESHTLYVSRQNGTVPAESYQSVGSDILELPADLTRIESEAFRGSPAEIVIIPKGCTEIGSLAFADMPNLKEITIPSSVTVIGSQIFGEGGSFAVYANSEAAREAALQYPGLLVLTE